MASETTNAATLARIADELRHLREHLAQVRQNIEGRADAEEVRQALSDITSAYALVGQLVEVYEGQKVITRELSERIAESLETAADERAEIKEVLVQVREVLRNLVRASEDLARAVGAGDGARPVQKRRKSA